MRVTKSIIRLGLVTTAFLLSHTAADLSLAQPIAGNGIILPTLGENPQNIDVTENGTNPVGQPANGQATVSIGFDLMNNPVTPMEGTATEASQNVVNDLVVFTGAPPNRTKWNDLQGGTIMLPLHITLSAPKTVRYYTVTSANDSAERDPFEWRLLGSTLANPTSMADFTLIEERTGVEYSTFHQTQLFGPVNNNTAYLTYRFEFETERVALTPAVYDTLGKPIPNSIQMAEIELFENFAFAGPKVTINRTTGAVTLANRGNATFNVLGYSLTSPAGTLNSDTWLSFTNNYDGNSGGATPLDNDNWIRLTEPSGRNDISEVVDPNGDGAAVVVAQTINLGNSWIRFPTEDVTGEILLADGTTRAMSVEFEGNGGQPFRLGDLNFSGGAAPINAADWNTFKQGQAFNFSTVVARAESYARGDLDGDFDHDLDDFAIFKGLYDAANGSGSFVAMLASVPEPGTMLLVGIAAIFGFCRNCRRRGVVLAALIAATVLVAGAETSHGQTILPGLIGSDLTDADNVAPRDAVVTSEGNSPANEQNVNAIDNLTNTKWLSFLPNGAFYQTRFRRQSRSAVNSYTITSANDAEERDPYSWTLSGSNDGTNFTVVDTRTAQDFTARFETRQYTFTNTTPYNYYRFAFQTSTGAGVPTTPAPTAIQLAEIELFGTPLVPNVLTLEVNASNGTIRIANKNTAADGGITFDAYRILSPSGALNRNAWWGAGPTGGSNGGQSIHDQNLAGFPQGTGGGQGWEEGPGSSNNQLAEWYLGPGGVGSSTLGTGQSVTMNNVFQVGGAQDLTFEYHIAGETILGAVEYIGAPTLPGDYNQNGRVDAADYVMWRKNPGAFGGNPAGYNTWRANFGRTAGSGAGNGLGAGSAVPEPAAGLLALCIPSLFLFARRRPSAKSTPSVSLDDSSEPVTRSRAMAQVRRIGFRAVYAFVAASCVFSSSNAVGETVDRNYQMGDDAQENAVAGQTVGQASVVPAHTLDSASQGSFFDIMQNGGPTYVNASPTGGATARTGARANEKAIQFTGSSSQYLTGAGFGAPREGGALANPPITTYPDGRYMQIWARPTLDTGARQDVVNDTLQFGIHITPTDTWGHTYGATTGVGNVFDTGAPVNYNQWTHIMQQTIGTGGVAVYVNGVAVSRFNAGYAAATGPADNRNLYVGTNLGASGNFFTGQTDSLQIGVYGTFIPGPPLEPIPAEWGALDLGTDNEYIASQGLVPGDVNGDGVVNGTGTGPVATDDVSFFIAHWLDERRVNNFVIGDLTSRTTLGDLNFDGRTSLADWAILRNAHAGGASLDLAALLAGVPEPSSVTLVGLALVAAAGRWRRRTLS